MFKNLRYSLTRFLTGRNGPDTLYNAAMIAELVLLFISTILRLLGATSPVFSVLSLVLYALSLALLCWSLFRFFSRNLPARRRENAAFVRVTAKLRRKKKPVLPPDTPTHIFRTCPHCHSTLRLPRTPGKHEVKCPRCSGRFRVKVKG